MMNFFFKDDHDYDDNDDKNSNSIYNIFVYCEDFFFTYLLFFIYGILYFLNRKEQEKKFLKY